jgi:hypothetical protein
MSTTDATRKEVIKIHFATESARRHALGLPKKQAEVITLSQLIRDARNGLLDRECVRDFIIDQEVANGSGRPHAETVVDGALAGKPFLFTRRDYGYEKTRPRHRKETRELPPASEELSHWANQNFPNPSESLSHI